VTRVDLWTFYDITHREHVICNPTSLEKLSWLVDLLRLAPGSRVIDIACGKAEFLIRLAERYRVQGTGVDISPHFVAEAARRLGAHELESDITLLEMDGAEFEPPEGHRFALASCLGASWIFGGHARTLDALIRLVEPGGWVLAGEPFWRQEPPAEYLEAIGERRETFGTHASNVTDGEERGLVLVHTMVSNQDEWDRYEGLQWYAAEAHARLHPDDRDAREVSARVAREKDAYLRWGRDTLGWAIYVFRRR
jgi:SAM-dependent methyltransferase